MSLLLQKYLCLMLGVAMAVSAHFGHAASTLPWPISLQAISTFKSGSQRQMLPLSELDTLPRFVETSFGIPLAPGAVPAGQQLTLQTSAGIQIPSQFEIKTRHADGSIRHGIVSAAIPQQQAHESLQLKVTPKSIAPSRPIAPAQLFKSLQTLRIELLIDPNDICQLSFDANTLSRFEKNLRPWLSGPVATEWVGHLPFECLQRTHPTLTVSVALRHYHRTGLTRVSLSLDNLVAYHPSIKNELYNVIISHENQVLFTHANVFHRRQTRWRLQFFLNGLGEGIVKYDPELLTASWQIPNYALISQNSPTPTMIQKVYQRWATHKQQGPWEPRNIAMPMSMPGGRDDLGLLPQWIMRWLFSQNNLQLREIMLDLADRSGFLSLHWLDQNTHQPVWLRDHPGAGLFGGPLDLRHRGINYRFPEDKQDPKSYQPFISPKLTAVVTHSPSLVYVPYLITGDYFYLEELKFWASFSYLWTNPAQRNYDPLLAFKKISETRATAWGLRNIGQAISAMPDQETDKPWLIESLQANLRYLSQANQNHLSIHTSTPYTFAYHGRTGIAPWQDDYLTSVYGHLAELGFSQAVHNLNWKGRFIVDRFTAPGICWLYAGTYTLKIKDTPNAPLYRDLLQVYQNSNVPNHRCHGKEMIGYPKSIWGYPAFLQPALAYATQAKIPRAQKAWSLYQSREPKQSWPEGNGFNIIPRSAMQPLPPSVGVAYSNSYF